MNHKIIPMFVLSFIAGLLSTMNVWVEKISDIRIGLNDIYMSLLMTGWMFLLMGIYHRSKKFGVIGIIIIILSFICIRSQFLINEKQYLLGMIPHHSMAIHMSNTFLKNHKSHKKKLNNFVKHIKDTQSREITWMVGQSH